MAQRVYGLALGYEGLDDHDVLRKDSALALLVGEQDLTGEARIRERDRGHPLAGSSTLNRLELSTPDTAPDDRYKKIAANPAALDRLLVDVFLESQRKPPREIWLDLDATDDPLHGHQEGRFFHGDYRCYCYLPLYIFCGEYRDDAGQPTALVFLVVCLRAIAWLASTGSCRYGACQSAEHDDPGKAVENRCPHPDHGAQGLVVLLRSLSLCRRHRADLGQSPAPSGVEAARLNDSSHDTLTEIISDNAEAPVRLYLAKRPVERPSELSQPTHRHPARG